MTASTDTTWRQRLQKQLASQAPFSLLSDHQLSHWLQDTALLRFNPGERLLRPDELSSCLYLVLQGEVRLIVFGDEAEGQISLDRRGAGQLLGWASLLRASPTEFVHASTEVVAVTLQAAEFVALLQSQPAFATYFSELTNVQEAYLVAVAAAELLP